jgi:hypothetical protein
MVDCEFDLARVMTADLISRWLRLTRMDEKG